MLAKQRAELEEEMRRRDEALGRKPAPVAAPAAPAVDLTPVMAAPSPAPVLAPTTPVHAPPPAPAPPDPLQVASMAPPPVAVEALDPRFPKVGDRWQYVYKDPFKRETRDVEIEVIGVSRDGILDEDDFSIYGKGARAHGPGAELLMLRGVWQFSPYLQVFGAAQPGARWDDIVARNDGFCRSQPSCTYSARVTGRDRVTTPAGTFDAVTVAVDLTASGFGGFHTRRRATFWYAESVKRFVKSTVRTLSGNPRVPDYDLDLVSYKLN
jgi:hypothetical protein